MSEVRIIQVTSTSSDSPAVYLRPPPALGLALNSHITLPAVVDLACCTDMSVLQLPVINKAFRLGSSVLYAQFKCSNGRKHVPSTPSTCFGHSLMSQAYSTAQQICSRALDSALLSITVSKLLF